MTKMTEKKNYPEEIYCKDYVIGEMHAAERAYDLGLRDGAKPSDPLAGFSNLTQAIQDGVRIDWERLDGLKAKCSHFVLGELTFRLDRNPNYAEDTHLGWIRDVSKIAPTWKTVMEDAWEDCGGWSLWVEGEIPVKKRTADELEPGTCFYGKLREVTGTFFIFINSAGAKRAYSLGHSDLYEPEKVEVLEVYGIGTLQATKEEA